MKTANDLNVRNVPARDRSDPAYTDPEGRERAEKLLRLYPNTTEEETVEIRHFLTKGRILEVGLISGSDEFRDKVAAFRKEHERHFRLKLHEIVAALLIVTALVGALLWYFAS